MIYLTLQAGNYLVLCTSVHDKPPLWKNTTKPWNFWLCACALKGAAPLDSHKMRKHLMLWFYLFGAWLEPRPFHRRSQENEDGEKYKKVAFVPKVFWNITEHFENNQGNTDFNSECGNILGEILEQLWERTGKKDLTGKKGFLWSLASCFCDCWLACNFTINRQTSKPINISSISWRT